MSWLISRIATRAGADDLIFMLMERTQQRRAAPVYALVQSLYAAIVDRLLWVAARLGHLDVVDALSRTVAYNESIFFFCGVALVSGSSVSNGALWLQALLHRFFPWSTFSMVVIVVLGLYLILLWSGLRITGVILECPTESMFHGRVFMSVALGAVGMIAVWSEIGHSGWWIGTLTVAFWLGCAFTLAKLRGVIIERRRELCRAKAAYWGPGGRPIGSRDVRHTFPAIVSTQNRRRGRSRWSMADARW
ncbi:MAG: hypothetical protein ACYDHD_03565 [Vulcanimicrobiaceae bacterium]